MPMNRSCSIVSIRPLGMSGAGAAVLLLLLAVVCHAQPAGTGEGGAGMHPLHTSGLPLGEVGQTQLARRDAPSRLFYQPVRFTAPEGVEIALAAEGDFAQPRRVPLVAGLRLGRVYRFRLTQIPLALGSEIFPTIELLDRVYPPQGRELDFPIEVVLTHDDIAIALAGRFVTKVIYVENPTTAIADRTTSPDGTVFDLPPGSDPLAMADTLGRPVAIVRLGGRQPSPHRDDYAHFLLGCPPWLEFARDEQGNTLFRERLAASPTTPMR